MIKTRWLLFTAFAAMVASTTSGCDDAKPIQCGNGKVEAGETCDDGNTDNTDACTNACAAASCGDGYAQAGVEACDDGNTSNTDGCLTTCVAAKCGDGYIEAGIEGCDDMNTVNTDSCSNTCLIPSCGDGVLQVGNGEFCDDGNAVDTDGCLHTCQLPTCGDGFVRAGVEQCDDGNSVNTDGCVSGCQSAACGDGYVQSGTEGCDDGNTINTDSCRNDCTIPTCGDGVVQLANGEQCDDGNAVDTDGCLHTCQVATCGDGQVHMGVEQCDDANLSNTDGCTNACQTAACGDGIVQAGVEECDDANTIDTDSCRNNCQQASCGDGVVQLVNNEQCDDGLTAANGDGCSTTCQTEAGWVCSSMTPGSTSSCAAAGCGDGIVAAGEACDDGNLINTDTCDNTCQLNACGDGQVNNEAPTSVEFIYNGMQSTYPSSSIAIITLSADGGTLFEGWLVSTSDYYGCTTGVRRMTTTDPALLSRVRKTGTMTLSVSNAYVAWAKAVIHRGNQSETVVLVNNGNGAVTEDPNFCNTGYGYYGTTQTEYSSTILTGEDCDDMNTDNLDACSNACKAATCGDGLVSTGVGEACDDGGTGTGDGCDGSCHVEYGYSCQSASPGATSSCATVCGDGIVAGAEPCDDGNQSQNDYCLVTCVDVTCGDGIRNGVEGCDDGNQVDGDGCTACLLDSCGNGTLEAGEDCDDGNDIDGDACHNNCRSNGCGDAIVVGGEGCDDGNLTAGDGCEVDCQTYCHHQFAGLAGLVGDFQDPTTGTCYAAVNNWVPWQTAQTNCASVGGHLATIPNATIDSRLTDFVNGPLGGNAPWIGANDLAAEGTWTWDDGTPWSYTQWQPGEPNDSGNEDCGMLYTNGNWNDGQCPASLPYLCER